MSTCTCRLASSFAALDLTLSSLVAPFPRPRIAATTRHLHTTRPAQRLSGEALLRAQTGLNTRKDRHANREISFEDKKAYVWGENPDDANPRPDRVPGPWDEQLQELRRQSKPSSSHSAAHDPRDRDGYQDSVVGAPVPDGRGGFAWRSNDRHAPPVDPETRQRNRDLPEWAVQKEALKRKFPEGWRPLKRLSPDAQQGIKTLHKQFPDVYTTPVLANKFQVSPEVIRRILKNSDWVPSADEEVRRQERWLKRGEQVWKRYAALGVKPPRRWRDATGVEKYGAQLLNEHESEEGDESVPWDLEERIGSKLM